MAADARARELPLRLASKVAVREDGCWEWTGSRSPQGYARVRWAGRTAQAYRVVYELLCGPIAAGLTIDHLCRNPSCVNPEHLEPVTLRENIARGRGVGTINAAKTHCKHGHEFTPANTYIKGGKRSCRECGRQANRRHYAKRAAA